MKKNNKTTLKKIFDELDVKPKKHLGQNFLHDLNIIKAIVKGANVENENIIEIGPGPGNLTELIIKQKPKTIFAIEKDESFRKKLEDIKINNFKLFEYKIDDVLNFDFTKLEKKNYKIVSNLPYNISVPFISYMIKFQNTIKWKDMTLMVQKEVADRILADTGTKNYGRLSLMISLKNHITKIMNVNPTCFFPRPKVESTVIKIIPKEDKHNLNQEIFEKIVKICFSQRRKTIKNNLDQLKINTRLLLKQSKINANLRPENIDLEGFCRISINYKKLFKGHF